MTQDATQAVERLGIVLETADSERAWNALRLGITALEHGHEVSVFLLGAGVEAEEVTDDQFDVRDRMEAFVDAGGDLQACGTCLDIRNSEESEYCPMSTMADLLEIVTTTDRVLTIG
ncbi:DsrE family protein [Natrarchaeobius oligotrophus]|uniref:DsrE family protein n=1 Tax=Natrarchaeobius chitinivorans TaxID=1679083 RepID=A0A3N6MEJ4_NATCH|nr:DsrE family protein [Natrarchaeobius chitinivorans]RQH02404.1 DsrE family protein [Natrarchaeobius chitinivorans]